MTHIHVAVILGSPAHTTLKESGMEKKYEGGHKSNKETAEGFEPTETSDVRRDVIDQLDELTLSSMDDNGHLKNPIVAIENVVNVITDSPLSQSDKADLLLHVGGTFSFMLKDEEAGRAFEKKVKREYLPEMLGTEQSRQISREVGRLLRKNHTITQGLFGEQSDFDDTIEPLPSLLDDVPTLASLTPMTRRAVIDRLVDLKLVTKKEKEYRFPEKEKARKYLLSGDLELAAGWQRVKHRVAQSNGISTIDDAKESLERHNEDRATSHIIIETGKPGFSVAPINSLRIGHQDGLDGLKLVEQYIDHIDELDESSKPDILLVTDLMQGVYKHNQSMKRSALTPEFQDLNAQFRVANQLLNRLRATGIPVVVGMSENDHREAKDYAIDAVRELEGLLSDAEKNDFVSFSQLYKYSQNTMFQDFRRFALDYAIPLGQKYGRRLRTAVEMRTDSDGNISQSEFMHLYQHVKLGHGLDPSTGIDPDDITELGNWNSDQSMIYVDDCDLVFVTEDGAKHTIKYRHSLGLTTESLLSNHMINPQRLMGSLGMKAAHNDELPTALMTGQQQEAAMVTHSGTDIISNPGLTNPFDSVDTRSLYRRTPGDTSLRAFTTRRRAWSPGVYEYSRPRNGVVRYTFYDKDILERSESIPRMAIVTYNDWQIGSPTSHPDMIVHAQALAQEYATHMPVAIHGEGDFIHGHIYDSMPIESQAIGLFDIDSQTELTNSIISDTWMDVPSSTKDGVGHVLWLPGNHDQKQRVRLPSNEGRNVDTTLDTWRRVLEKAETNSDDSIVHTERMFQSDDGTPVPTWIGRPRYGDVNMAVAHFHINSKNYKGGSGGLAVYDPYKRLEGMGGFEDIQIASGAHHHNRMHTKTNGVMIDIGDANAAGQSEFESMLGLHHSNMSVKVREIGGGKPMTVSYYTEEALVNIPIKHGPYAIEQLNDAGFFDDNGADPLRYSIYSLDGSPRTAMQKRLWEQQRKASQRANHMAEPLHVPRGHVNRATRRMFEIAHRQLNREIAIE